MLQSRSFGLQSLIGLIEGMVEALQRKCSRQNASGILFLEPEDIANMIGAYMQKHGVNFARAGCPRAICSCRKPTQRGGSKLP